MEDANAVAMDVLLFARAREPARAAQTVVLVRLPGGGYGVSVEGAPAPPVAWTEGQLDQAVDAFVRAARLGGGTTEDAGRV
jgi:hypothetical protein